MRAGAFFLCREVPAPGRRVRRPDQSTRPTGRSARGVRCEPRDLAPQNLSILPARFPGPRPRPRVTLDRAKTRGFVHARSMVFSPGQVRQKGRSEEHTSELQSLMRISYAVFCLKQKTYILPSNHTT